MDVTIRNEAEKAAQGLGTTGRKAEPLLKSEGDGSDLRAKLRATLERASALCDRLQERTVAAAKTTDRAVREHPYHAAGIAFGVGLLVGVLAALRRNRD